MVDVPAAASRLAEELRASRQASGLSFGQIIQQGKRQSPPVALTKSTLSAWFNAQSVPRAGHAFIFLTELMESRAGSRLGPRSRARWENLRRAAERSRTTVRRDSAATGPRTQRQHGDKPRSARPLHIGLVPDTADVLVARAHREDLARALDGPEDRDVGDAVGAAVRGRVITGTGGVGKTSLAADYCRRAAYGEDGGVDVLIWVTANTTPAVTGAYAQAAHELELVPSSENTAAAAERFLNWLRVTDRSWLIVLDDVHSPGALEGLWAPRRTAGRGRVIVTTRSRERDLVAASGHLFLSVGVFTPEESLTHLRNTLQRLVSAGADAELAGLADDLGHLPLALSRAAAYLDYNASCSIARYRCLLADRRLTLERLVPAVRGSAATSSLAALWDISVEQADQHTCMLARPMLELAAVLDGTTGIPAPLFTSDAARDWLTERSGADRPVDELEAEHTLATLDRLHLIDHSPGESCDDAWLVHVHQLIQRAVREQQPPGSSPDIRTQRRNTVLPAAAHALLDIWPDTAHDQDHAQRLRASARLLATHDQDGESRPLWQDGTAYTLLFRLGTSAGVAGDISWARAHFDALRSLAHQHLGADHPHTLVARGELSRWQSQTGDHAGAVQTLESLEADHTRLFGYEAPETLVTRHNLAVERGEAGDASGVIGALEEVLAVRQRNGASRGAILATLHNLCYWKGVAGDAAEAASAYRGLIPLMEEEFGADADGTLTARHNLARWLGESGNAAEAVSLLEALLPDQTRALGPRHLRALTTRQSLARWQGEAGEADKAIDGYQALIPDMREVLGPDHPELLTARYNLAHLQARVEPATAAESLAAVIADRTRVLGPYHPATLTSRHSHALCLGWAGKPQKAVQALEDVIRDQQRSLVPEEAGILSTRHSLAVMRGFAGAPQAAITALQELLADQERVLGPGHLQTLETLDSLGHWQGATGDAQKASDTYQDLLTHIERHLGPDHVATLSVLDKLAMWRGRAGYPGEAVHILTRMLTDTRRVVDPAHPIIRTISNNIDYWLNQAGNEEHRDQD
ncbi:tetratricopeptide repeat protein [Streptomyces sp. DH18]|uniref:tetratricopeptide repeat protein n=1 Tax=Streptomyces sp. DH18 TaxID=3040126 RepID=UPI0024426928|nr:tetratricopeptide repeat protein [Streptomyces sp. DH18]MDG9686144.1 tetratricopeptide repeat protein [Streptomyces sp. DH18]